MEKCKSCDAEINIREVKTVELCFHEGNSARMIYGYICDSCGRIHEYEVVGDIMEGRSIFDGVTFYGDPVFFVDGKLSKKYPNIPYCSDPKRKLIKVRDQNG